MTETWRNIDWDEIDTGYTYGTHANDSGLVKDQLKAALFDEYEKVLQMHHDRVQNVGLEGSIPSATTPDIGAKIENILLVTGTTPITGFVTADAGATRELVFADVLTLTDGATLKIYPSGRRDIITAAGDWALVRSRGSGDWECIRYQRADGFPLLGTIQNLPANTVSVLSTTTAMNYGTGIPQKTEGLEVLTKQITPKYSDSEIIISGFIQASTDAATRQIAVALFQDSIGNALSANYHLMLAADQSEKNISFHFRVPSSSVVARTYKVRAGMNITSTFRINASRTGSAIFSTVSRTHMQVNEVRYPV